MVFESLWNMIKGLLRIGNSVTTEEQQRENSNNAAKYSDISYINFTAIFSNRLATLATAESGILIESKNSRAELLGNTVSSVWRKIKKITSMALGTGGCLIVPYVKDGQMFFDIVSQDRLCINAESGKKITSATVLAETATVNFTTYFRWVDYTVQNGNIVISHRVTTESGRAASLPQWEYLQDISISNVDRVLFGFIKSPVDNRKTSDSYGVPVTYGCDKIIEEIKECLGQIKDEFNLKEVRLFADERMFDRDKNGKLILKSKLFFAGKNPSNERMFDIFDPALRESSYYSRLTNLFELLEKSIGTSKGILTAPETRGATATEIKAGLFDTFAMLTDIREAIESGINDFLYACDVLANYYILSPAGEYECAYDWNYGLVESSEETWRQKKDLQSVGAMSKAELRAWQTGEDLETAQKAVDEITAKEPSLSSLVGMSE